ncbi:MAG: C1 family peptidase, partial [Planctomycetota bacterium]
MSKAPTWKTPIILCLILLFILIPSEICFGQERFRKYKLGCIHTDPTKVPGVKIIDGVKVEKSGNESLPPSTDLSSNLPPVGDQAQQGSCTAWATGYYYKAYQEWQERGWDLTNSSHQMSPAYIYNIINDGTDDGSNIIDAFRMMSNLGVCSLNLFPYSDSDCTTWASEACFDEACLYREDFDKDVVAVYVGSTYGLGLMKERLNDGNLIVLGIDVYDSFYDIENHNYVYDVTNLGGSLQGGHALAIVGYDDDMVTDDGTGAFKLINSWGSSWGCSGFFWISYEGMMNESISRTWVYYMDDRVGHAPDLKISFGITHAKRGELKITAGVGDSDTPLWSRDVFSYRGGDHAWPANNVVVDISEARSFLNTSSTTNIFIKVVDDSPGTGGTIENCTVIDELNSVSATCTTTPISMTPMDTEVANVLLPPGFPDQPSNPVPPDGATNQPIDIGLGWNDSARATGYYVYFGSAYPPPYDSSVAVSDFDPGVLAHDTSYYWKLIAYNGTGNSAELEGSFSTNMDGAPLQASTPFPADGTVEVPVDVILTWNSGSVPEQDLYFGTAFPPPLMNANHSVDSYDPGILSFDQTFYWRIDTRNASGTTSGSIWSFRTIVEAPDDITGITPADAASDQSVATTLDWDDSARAEGYYVFFDSSFPPAYNGSAISSDFDPGPLSYLTTYYWKIIAYNAGGNSSDAAGSFTTIIERPEIPANPVPGDGAADWPASNSLSWDAAARADGYYIFLGNSTQPPYVGSNTSAMFNPGLLDYLTTYYWKVVAYNAGGNSAATYFEDFESGTLGDWTTGGDNQWFIESPGYDGSTYCARSGNVANDESAYIERTVSIGDGGATLTFRWKVSSEEYYDFLWFDVDGVTQAYIAGERGWEEVTYALAQGTHTLRWRYVKDAFVTNGFDSGWIDNIRISAVEPAYLWTFRTAEEPPAQASGPTPSDGATGQSLSVMLEWNPAARADSYDVYLDTANPPLACISSNQSGTTHTPAGLDYDTSYYWRIDSINTGGTTEGPVWSFRTQIAPPSVATVPLPAYEGQNVSITTDLLWNAANAAEGYHIHFGTNSDPPYVSDLGNVMTYDPGVLGYYTSYYWKVVPYNAGGNAASVTVWSFQTAEELPDQASSPVPGDTATDVAVSITLEWQVAARAAAYDVYLDTQDPPLACVSSAQAGNSYDPPADLAFDTTYYWRIDAKNTGGTTQGAVWSFRTIIEKPTDISGLTPADGTQDLPLNTTLDWSDSARAEGYYIFFDTNSPPAYNSSVIPSDFDPGALDYYTTYYWKIIAYNVGGNSTEAAGSFRTIIEAPADISGVTPTDAAQNQLITIILNWGNSARAEGYHVFFETISPPAFNASVTQSDFDPGTLDYLTTYYWKIIAYNVGGNSSEASGSFRTIIEKPADVTGITPADGSQDMALNTTLDWDNSARAEGYHIFFGTGSPPAYNSSVVLSDFDPGALDYYTTYYWKIIAYNIGGNSAETSGSFQTIIEAPADISGVSPSDAAQDISISTLLDWDNSQRAEGYHVYFGTGSPPPYNSSVTLSEFDPGNLDYLTTYYWKIIAYNVGGNSNEASGSFQTVIEKPEDITGVTPVDGTQELPLATTLDWSDSGRAEGYYVHFGTNALPAYNCSVVSSDFDPGTLDYYTTYYWKLIAYNVGGNSSETSGSFRTIIEKPADISGVTPADGSQNAATDTILDWSDSARAEGYHVFFDTNSPPAYNGSETSSEFNPGVLDYLTTYYWKIIAYNVGGNSSEASGSFRTITEKPADVTGITPADGSQDLALNTTLDWDNSARAEGYHMYYGAGSPPAYIGTSASSDYDPGILNYFTTYYWKIIAYNVGGNSSEESGSFRTIIEAPADITGITPPDGAQNRPLTVILNWDNSVRAEGYHVFFDTVSPPTFNASVTQSDFDPGTLDYLTTYYWKIIAYNVGGNSAELSGSFRTIIEAPADITGVMPSNGAQDQPLTAILDWGSSARAEGYHVFFSAGSPPAYNSSVVPSDFDPGALDYYTTYYWKIIAYNIGGNSAEASGSFRTIIEAPADITGVTPTDAAQNQLITIVLDWDNSARAAGYYVFFDTSSPPAFNASVMQSDFDPGTLDYLTTYYWKIIAYNVGGNSSEASGSFRTIIEKPADLSGITPTDGSQDMALNTTLDWDNLARAEGYHIFFGTGSPPAYNSSVVSSDFDPGTLDYYTTYYWKIIAYNVGGNSTEAAGSFRTIIEAPADITGVTPPDGAQNQSVAILMDWADSARAGGYYVSFGTVSPPTYNCSVTSSDFDPGTLDY